MILTPLIDNVNIRTYKGRFDVQLEIPENSTLSERDINSIGALASWDVNPNGNVGGYEGGRSILIQREHSTQRGGIELTALQISGIGYQKIDFKGELAFFSNGEFYPPTNQNYIDLVPGTLMSTSRAKNGEIVSSRPSYRAYGTYTSDELIEKINKTMEISSIKLEKLVISNVEAYGRYRNEDFQNEEGPYGFMICSVPSVGLERAIEEVRRNLASFLEQHKTNMMESIMAYHAIGSLFILPLIEGLRELHDVARCAHLQTHMSNYYIVKGKPYLMDWATKTKLSDAKSDREDNVLNRIIDIGKPEQNFTQILKGIFGDFLNPNVTEHIGTILYESILEVYSGNIEHEIKLSDLVYRYGRELGSNATDDKFIAKWMKDEGVEGFQRKVYQLGLQQVTQPSPNTITISKKAQSRLLGSRIKTIKNTSQKIGRNDPCPCNSGKKFKKCCGGH